MGCVQSTAGRNEGQGPRGARSQARGGEDVVLHSSSRTHKVPPARSAKSPGFAGGYEGREASDEDLGLRSGTASLSRRVPEGSTQRSTVAAAAVGPLCVDSSMPALSHTNSRNSGEASSTTRRRANRERAFLPDGTELRLPLVGAACPATMLRSSWAVNQFTEVFAVHDDNKSRVQAAIDVVSNLPVLIRAYDLASISINEEHALALECNLRARCKHPNVLATYAAFVDRGIWYLVTQCPHSNLPEIIDSIPRDPAVVVHDILRPILQALHHLHGMSATSRVLVPASICFDEDGRPLLWDRSMCIGTEVGGAEIVQCLPPEVVASAVRFERRAALHGADAPPRRVTIDENSEARASAEDSSEMVAVITMVGRREWVRGHAASASDVWGIGSLAAYLLTGKLPFGDDLLDAAEIATGGAETWRPDPSLSPQAVDFVRRCLALNPSERPSLMNLLFQPLMTSTPRPTGSSGVTFASVTEKAAPPAHKLRTSFSDAGGPPAHSSAAETSRQPQTVSAAGDGHARPWAAAAVQASSLFQPQKLRKGACPPAARSASRRSQMARLRSTSARNSEQDSGRGARGGPIAKQVSFGAEVASGASTAASGGTTPAPAGARPRNEGADGDEPLEAASSMPAGLAGSMRRGWTTLEFVHGGFAELQKQRASINTDAHTSHADSPLNPRTKRRSIGLDPDIIPNCEPRRLPSSRSRSQRRSLNLHSRSTTDRNHPNGSPGNSGRGRAAVTHHAMTSPGTNATLHGSDTSAKPSTGDNVADSSPTPHASGRVFLNDSSTPPPNNGLNLGPGGRPPQVSSGWVATLSIIDEPSPRVVSFSSQQLNGGGPGDGERGRDDAAVPAVTIHGPLDRRRKNSNSAPAVRRATAEMAEGRQRSVTKQKSRLAQGSARGMMPNQV